MAKNILRKITIDNEVYLWKREHIHLTEYKHSQCVEKVVIYLEGFKKSPLQLFFREEDNLSLNKELEKEKWCVGYPDAGVIWLYKFKPRLPNNESQLSNQEQIIEINLNRPAVITELINYFLQFNWKPKDGTRPCVVEDALKFLELIALPNGIK